MRGEVTPHITLSTLTPFLRYLAVTIWLASLLSPTLASEGDFLLGYELALNGLMALLILLPISLIAGFFYWLSLATNLLLANEVIRCLRRSQSTWSVLHTVMFQGALILNVGVVSSLNRGADFPQLRGLTSLPGVYLWLGAFGILTTVATVPHRAFFTGLATRLAAVGLVALLVVIASLASLFAFDR